MNKLKENTLSYTECLELLKRISIDAGKLIMEIYDSEFLVEYKESTSPITEADTKANELIVSSILNKYPTISILSEELKDDLTRLENKYCFIIDPLDGTKEFINRNGEFTVNIALTYNGKPIIGVIYVPAYRKIYYASRGNGAFIEDTVSKETKQIKVSNKLENLVWIGSKSHSSVKDNDLINKHRNQISDVISVGSSLKGCMIAEGKADVYYRFGLTHEWDIAAMHCIVEEAGGILKQMNGLEMMYNRENNLNKNGFYIVNRKENIWI